MRGVKRREPASYSERQAAALKNRISELEGVVRYLNTLAIIPSTFSGQPCSQSGQCKTLLRSEDERGQGRIL